MEPARPAHPREGKESALPGALETHPFHLSLPPSLPPQDALLQDLVDKYGPRPKKWSLLAQHIPGRAGKQCRERWLNHLDQSVKKGEWEVGEDAVLCEAQRRLGNKWSEIAKLLPGRAENSVKNRFK